MSDRGFFNIRYSFPGYAFLLFSILICLEKLPLLLDWMEKTLNIQTNEVQILFSILIVLNGAPIGFIFSQLWFLLKYLLEKYWRTPKHLKTLQELTNRYSWLEKYDNAALAYEYIFYSAEEKTDRFIGFAERRFDLIATLGALIIAILGGLISGYYLIIYVTESVISNWHYVISGIGIGIIFLNLITLLKIRDEYLSLVSATLKTMNLEKILAKLDPIMENDY